MQVSLNLFQTSMFHKGFSRGTAKVGILSTNTGNPNSKQKPVGKETQTSKAAARTPCAAQ
jgi:hypothetical protein